MVDMRPLDLERTTQFQWGGLMMEEEIYGVGDDNRWLRVMKDRKNENEIRKTSVAKETADDIGIEKEKIGEKGPLGTCSGGMKSMMHQW